MLRDGGVRLQVRGVLGFKFLHEPDCRVRLAGESSDAARMFLALFPESLEPRHELGEPRHPLRSGRDLPLLGLDLRVDLPVPLLRPLLRPFERLEAEQLLEDLEAVRAPLGPEVLHLLLADERRVREARVVEPEDVPDRALPLRDRTADRLPIAGELQVRVLLRREPSLHVEAGLSLPERDPYVPAGVADLVDRRVR